MPSPSLPATDTCKIDYSNGTMTTVLVNSEGPASSTEDDCGRTNSLSVKSLEKPAARDIQKSACAFPNCLEKVESQFSSVLDFEGVTPAVIHRIGSEMIRLTTEWQKKTINTLNKQF